MKKLLILLLALFPFVLCAQQRIVRGMSDTVFHAGDIVRIPQVLYDLGKTTLRPESKDSLDKVVDFLNRHPSFVVEIGVHTDSRANDALSYRPWQGRAQSCADYLISKGIAKERIIPKGYGKTKLLVSDAEISKLKTKQEQEEAHQKNRRTELKILRMDYVAPGN